jgi:hypothetical protein
MAFPASLATKTVTGTFQIYPAGAPGVGSAVFSNSNWLFSTGDDTIIAPFEAQATLDGAGEFTIDLPATDDPQWTPQGWSYGVTITVSGSTLSGSLEVPHDHVGEIDISDHFTPEAPSAGASYILITQKGIAGGVAALDADGDVNDAAGNKVLAPTVSETPPVDPEEGDFWFEITGG